MNDQSRSRVPRVAVCAAGEIFGGVERHVLDLAAAWGDTHGEPPMLLLFHDAETAAIAREKGLSPIILTGRQKYDPAPGLGMGDILGRNRIEVVHAHGYRAAVTCLLASRRHRFAVVKTEHGKVEAGRWSNPRGLRMRLNTMADVWATRRLGAGICYVTDDLARHFAGMHSGLDRRTIRNGVAPLDRTEMRRPEELRPDCFNVLIAGRLAPVKGIDQAIAALPLADPGREVRLVIAGDGPSAEQLREQASGLGVGDRIDFLGFRRDIFDFMAHADALLMPSLHEGLPYVLLEAMSLGTPILAAAVGGLAEVLSDEVTGLLFPPADPGAIAASLTRLVRDPDLARRIGIAAAVEQREAYTLERMAAQYARAYAAAAGSSTGG